MRLAPTRQVEARGGLIQAPNDTPREGTHAARTYTPSPRRRPGPRGGARIPPQRPTSTNTHLPKWPPFRHPRHRSGISPQTGNLHTVAPAKAGAQGRGMETASTPDIDEHPPSEMAPLPSSPTPTGDLLPHPPRAVMIMGRRQGAAIWHLPRFVLNEGTPHREQ